MLANLGNLVLHDCSITDYWQEQIHEVETMMDNCFAVVSQASVSRFHPPAGCNEPQLAATCHLYQQSLPAGLT